jgi:O-antigen/teichoic acid export membrane protein
VDSESVKQSTLSGLRWFALKSVVGEVLGVTSTVALARLVTPVQFGYAAVALVFNLLAVILTFEGFAAALVQRSEITERHKQASVFLNLVGGGALMGFVLLMVPIVWQPIFGSETAKLIALTSPSFLIAGIGSVSRALLWRRLDFRRVTQIDLLSTFGGNVVAVVMAVLKFGAVALVVGADVGIALTSVLMLLAAPEPLPRFHLKEVKDIVGYGARTSSGSGSTRHLPTSSRRSRGTWITQSSPRVWARIRPGSITARSTWGSSTSRRSATS